MRITPKTQTQADALARVLSYARQCAASCDPTVCSGLRWVWDPRANTAVRQLCPRATEAVRAKAAQQMIEASGVPPDTKPIVCSWLSGLTVVCPDWKATTLDHELQLRRTTAGIVAGWIISHQQQAYYLPYYLVPGFWRDHVHTWKHAAMLAFVSWHFRGLSEEHASVFNDILLHRLDSGLQTVVCCSADPSLLTPRWKTDVPVVDAIQHPNYFVRVRL